jgi:hypothetical protein
MECELVLSHGTVPEVDITNGSAGGPSCRARDRSLLRPITGQVDMRRGDQHSYT